MRAVHKVLVSVVGAVGVALGSAGPVHADPAGDPCQLAVTFLCKYMPLAPDLDHDIDLTQGSATVNGRSMPELPAAGAGADESAPPPDVCSMGCI
ncbi:conserved exported hypothetical protein [uncultured Mycobacterium sp.]|uniref:Fibronectin-binding protein n=1 Tax=uncultured Mycobacterium sp. TaxID=171292 RepID=A0A1Y5PT65_9MYCO|nr:conserved exported hypothetical protein [uncultured Mycobacterium sp.]